MNEDSLNMEIRRFLKKVGITSQREIEKEIYYIANVINSLINLNQEKLVE